MKYVLLFCGAEADAATYDALSETERQALFERAVAWFETYRSSILDSDQLQGPEAVTHVRFAAPGGPCLVTDGPFLEGTEGIGGYAHIEVADLDEALRMARTWPCGGAVEIRPSLHP